MGKNVGMSHKVGKREIKSNVRWIEYDIDWFALAKTNCSKCYGRGYEGYEVRTDEEILENKERVKILCNCVVDRWSKMTDDERMLYATRKENADEILEKAKAEINKVVEELKAEQAQSE
jgi:hypothetical protein